MPPEEWLSWARQNPQAALQALQGAGIINVPPQAATATDSAAFAAQSRGNAPPSPPPTAMGIMGAQAQGVGSPSSWPQPPASPQQRAREDEQVQRRLDGIELGDLRSYKRAAERIGRREDFLGRNGLMLIGLAALAGVCLGMRWGRK